MRWVMVVPTVGRGFVARIRGNLGTIFAQHYITYSLIIIFIGNNQHPSIMELGWDEMKAYDRSI